MAGEPGQTSAQFARRTVRVLFAASGPDLRVEVAVLRDLVVPAVREWGETRHLDVEVYGTWTLDEPLVEHPDQPSSDAFEDPATAELRRLAQDPEVFFVAVWTRSSPAFDRAIVGDFHDLRSDDHSRGCLFVDQETALLAQDLPDLAPAQVHRLPDRPVDITAGPGPGGELYRLILDTLTDVIESAIRQSPVEADPAEAPSIPVMDEPVIDENVQFTVYRPRSVRVGVWYPLLAFAHLAERSPDAPADQPDPVDRVKTWAAQILGSDVADYASPTSDARGAVPRESELTFVPDIDGIEFNPPRRTFRWLEDVHKEEFRLRASPMVTVPVVRGRLTVFLGVLILADVDLVIRVDSSASTPTVEPTTGEVLNGTEPRNLAMEPVHAHPYRKIFPSYSHLDVAIVEQAEVLGRALGDVYVRDRTVLRSGEDWNARLLELIDDADIFQLFWSSNAMRSQYVRQEWEYALSRERPFFIRPTYWEEPMPRSTEPELPPPTLSRLHFQSLRRDALAARVASVPAAEPRPSPGGDRICEVCGAQNPPDAQFCWSCHSYLAWETPPVPGPQQAQSPLPDPGFSPVPAQPSASHRPVGPSAADPSTPPFDWGNHAATGAHVEPNLRRSPPSRRLPLLVVIAIAVAVAILIWVVLSRF